MRSALRLGVLSLILFASAAPTRAADIERFFPKETDAIISINVRQLLDSEVMKKHALDVIKKGIARNAEAEKAFEALGLNPLRDFERVTIGGGGDDPTTTQAVVVIEGKFDPAKINTTAVDLAKLKGDNIQVDKIADKTIFKLTGENQPNPMYAAVLDQNVIVMASSKDLLGTTFEAASGNKRSELKRDLAGLYSKADTRATMFLVAATKGKLEKVPVPDPNVKKVMEGIESFTAEVRVTKDVKIQVGFGVNDDDSAKVLSNMIETGLDQAKQFVPLIAIQEPRLKPLGDVINNIKTSTKGKQVSIDVAVTADAIEQMIEAGKAKD